MGTSGVKRPRELEGGSACLKRLLAERDVETGTIKEALRGGWLAHQRSGTQCASSSPRESPYAGHAGSWDTLRSWLAYEPAHRGDTELLAAIAEIRRHKRLGLGCTVSSGAKAISPSARASSGSSARTDWP